MTGAGRAPILEARGLAKRYRGVDALAGLDLSLAEGEAVALLGPNGAGKTTLLSMLAGISTPGAGSLEWREDAVARVGWVPQKPAVYLRLTVVENLRLFASLEGAADADAEAARMIERADLGDFADRLAANLSTGTLQRLNLAVALAGRPSVLLLDEPSATLSPDQRFRLWRWLDGLRERERLALVFSTQSVDEAARHGDRIVVLSAGRVVFEGSVADLVSAHGGDAGDRDAAEAAFMRLVAPGAAS